MNPTGASTGSQTQTLSNRLAKWRELLELCRRKPTRRRVHALRVVTLRIQVEAQDALDDLPHASHEAQAILRFGKLAQKLREVLAPLRELDVWIGKLRRLRESLSETTEYVPRSTRQMIRQIMRLEDRLQKKRQRAALKLVKKIEMRRQGLMLISRDLEEWGGVRTHEVDGTASAGPAKKFAAIVAEFPVLDVSNLHDFRKRLKEIRYIRAIHPASPECQGIATQMKKAQTAIGDWHDWQVLARTAARERHADVELVDLLASIASEAARSAIAVSQVTLQRMANLDREQQAEFDVPRKAPVRSESALSLSARKLA